MPPNSDPLKPIAFELVRSSVNTDRPTLHRTLFGRNETHGKGGGGDGDGGSPSNNGTSPTGANRDTSGTGVDKKALAGGIVGGVIGLILLLGLLWWIWRRRRRRNEILRRKKVEIDPDPGSGRNFAAVPIAASNALAGAPGERGGVKPTQRARESLLPRYWQIHNVSRSSLRQEALPSKAAMLSTLNTDPSRDRSRTRDADDPEAQSSSESDRAPASPTDPLAEPASPVSLTSSPLSPVSLGRSVSIAPTSSLSHDHSQSLLTRSTSLAVSGSTPATSTHGHAEMETQSEIDHLRRQVEILAQENVRLSTLNAVTEAPPAYVPSGREAGNV